MVISDQTSIPRAPLAGCREVLLFSRFFPPLNFFFFFFFLSAPLLCVYLALELASLVFAEMSTTVFLIFASLDFRPYMYHPLINPQSGKESFCVLCLHDT